MLAPAVAESVVVVVAVDVAGVCPERWWSHVWSPACKRPMALFLCASLSRGISFWFCSRLDTEVRQSKTLQFYSGGVHVARVSNAHALTTWFAPGRVLAILHVFDLHFQVYMFTQLLQWGCVWDPK